VKVTKNTPDFIKKMRFFTGMQLFNKKKRKKDENIAAA